MVSEEEGGGDDGDGDGDGDADADAELLEAVDAAEVNSSSSHWRRVDEDEVGVLM